MITPDAIISLLPLSDNDDPKIWIVNRDAIVDAGTLTQVTNVVDGAVLETVSVILIVPASHSTFRRVEAQGLEPKQELAVAKIRAKEQALGVVQTAAAFDQNGDIQIATMSDGLVQNALDRFAREGIRVAAVVPFGAIIQPVTDEILRAEIGGHAMLCSAKWCCVDEPSLALTLLGETAMRAVSETELAAALISLSSAPEPNFLDGMIVRCSEKPVFSEANWRWVKRLTVLAACLFLAGGALYWAKLQWAISSENKVALTAAQSIDPAINDIVRADAALDAALARKGIERAKPAMLIAIVWQAIKARENVAVTDVSLGKNGILSVTLSAPETQSINAALLSIQRAGYQITATPRRDASGTTLVDLTVQAP